METKGSGAEGSKQRQGEAEGDSRKRKSKERRAKREDSGLAGWIGEVGGWTVACAAKKIGIPVLQGRGSQPKIKGVLGCETRKGSYFDGVSGRVVVRLCPPFVRGSWHARPGNLECGVTVKQSPFSLHSPLAAPVVKTDDHNPDKHPWRLRWLFC